MFCSECGNAAEGFFCSHCGARLRHAVSDGWRDSLDYHVLTQIPEVRQILADAGQQAPRRLTGEEILARIDAALAVVGAGPVFSVVQIVAPIYSALGLKTSKRRSATFGGRPGELFVGLLSALARRGIAVGVARQATDGAVIEAVIPSDFWSFKGTLVTTVERMPGGVRMEIGTAIRGQLYDWGKSEKIIRQVFDELKGKGVPA